MVRGLLQSLSAARTSASPPAHQVSIPSHSFFPRPDVSSRTPLPPLSLHTPLPPSYLQVGGGALPGVSIEHAHVHRPILDND